MDGLVLLPWECSLITGVELVSSVWAYLAFFFFSSVKATSDANIRFVDSPTPEWVSQIFIRYIVCDILLQQQQADMY